MAKVIKALTLSQPYASLIASGEKWVENRKWGTNYSGPLAIHAGRGTQYLDREELKEYPTGVVLCVVDLVVCVPLVPGRPLGPLALNSLKRAGVDVDEFLDHEHTEGPFCWVVKNVRKVADPVPCKGAMGLWNWEVPETFPERV